MVCVSALLTVPLIMADSLCAGQDIAKLRQTLISSTFVSSGISTIIQTMFGMRWVKKSMTRKSLFPGLAISTPLLKIRKKNDYKFCNVDF